MIVLFRSFPLGARYMLLSGLGFALMAATVKLTSQRGLPLMEIIAARALVSLALSYVDVRRKGLSVWGVNRPLLVARAIVGTLALVCVYYAVIALPLADATVLQYLHPMFTALIALVYLGEKIQPATYVCIVLSLLGLILIARPGFIFSEHASELSLLAVGVAILGALGAATAYVLVRKLNQTDDPSVIIFYFPLFALPFSLLLLGRDFVWPVGWDWTLLILVGVFTQIGQIGLTKAMQVESAGKATAFSYIQVLFAAALGGLIFGEVPGFWTCLGGSLILVGVMINLRPRDADSAS